MSNDKILLTGDYWHQDFQSVISGVVNPLTLVPLEKIETLHDNEFSLVVIAQSRRDQICQDDVESIQRQFPNTPVVGLLGSWCEGDVRSGNPWPGVTRVYWHQWKGRYQRFLSQLESEGVTNWHSVPTATVADQISSQLEQTAPPIPKGTRCVGISAWTQDQYDMLADAVKQFGLTSRWVERTIWSGNATDMVSVVCIDANSWDFNLQQRIKWLRTEFPQTRMVVLLNFPRESDVAAANDFGISDIISKPFEIMDLKEAFGVEAFAGAND